ncbi:hypothetical protein GmHk_17G049186 [Glycine max]|nr:hypothetical protein GmHk_17G049186 [Glycine max]
MHYDIGSRRTDVECEIEEYGRTLSVSTSCSLGGFKFLENAKDLPTIMTSKDQCLNTMMNTFSTAVAPKCAFINSLFIAFTALRFTSFSLLIEDNNFQRSYLQGSLPGGGSSNFSSNMHGIGGKKWLLLWFIMYEPRIVSIEEKKTQEEFISQLFDPTSGLLTQDTKQERTCHYCTSGSVARTKGKRFQNMIHFSNRKDLDNFLVLN